MAKIDVSKIAGYADMTAEEKVAALEAYEDEVNGESEAEKLKKLLDKANSEAAGYKKQLRAKQTDEEANAAKRDEELKELQDKYNALLKEQQISSYAEKLRKQGYDEKLAATTAAAMADGDYDTILKNGETYRASLEQSIRANLTKETPKPNNGGSGGTKYSTKADIMKIKDATERQKAIQDNMELFRN